MFKRIVIIFTMCNIEDGFIQNRNVSTVTNWQYKFWHWERVWPSLFLLSLLLLEEIIHMLGAVQLFDIIDIFYKNFFYQYFVAMNMYIHTDTSWKQILLFVIFSYFRLLLISVILLSRFYIVTPAESPVIRRGVP